MKTVQGDLIKLFQNGEFDVMVHGSNCFCSMGAGIAAQIAKHYPVAYQADLRTNKGDPNKLGTISIASIINPMCENQQYIVNAYTQFRYGTGKRQVDYVAVRECFRTIKLGFSGKRIAYPAIGAGLAGGCWKTISAIIDKELEGENHTFVEYKQ